MNEDKIFPKNKIPSELYDISRGIYRSIFGTLLEDDEETPHLISEEPVLFLGSIFDARNLDKLKKHKIKYVLCMTDDKESYEYYEKKGFSKEIKWKGIAASDLDDYNIFRHFEETFEFIETAHKEKSAILVHCAAGVSRSATIVCAYLIRKHNMSAKDAVMFVHNKRRCICPNLGFMAQLALFEQELKKSQNKEEYEDLK